tara:strand:- start:1802 stop:2134 length:333 start_codon:yes stop_codon:yes gene_type:complete
VEVDIAGAIKDFGFPIVAAMGMGYFIYFIWQWVTETIDPVIGETMGTLIKLVDRVRMLDNDMIRLNQKLAMVLEYKAELEQKGFKLDDELEKVLSENRTKSQGFNSTGKK